jgi:hypothetical protein
MRNNLLIITIFISSCTTYEYDYSYDYDYSIGNIEIDSNYARSEISWSLEEGNNIIEGDGFLMRRDGQIVKCSGRKVELIPQGTYSKERMKLKYGTGNFVRLPMYEHQLSQRHDYTYEGIYLELADPKYTEDIRSTICNIDGKFKFKNIPNGDYFIETIISWGIGDFPQGGFVYEKIPIKSREDEEIYITLSNR